MTSAENNCKVWIRFEVKKKDGSFVKLRIQDLPKNRMDDYIKFITTYFVKDESMHKAAGIYKSEEAQQEYIKILSVLHEMNPPMIVICCLDNDTEDFEEILAASTIVQSLAREMSLEQFVKELQIQSKEVQALLNIIQVVTPMFPQSLKDKYETYYEGRGIIVHPEFRGLGIASHIVRNRRMICDEYKIPMTSAWMTSVGSQKASERNGWETIAEISVEELGSLTGLDFGNDVPSYKLMMATGYQL